MTASAACDRWRQAIFEAADPIHTIGADAALGAHHQTCADCRAWFRAYVEGLADSDRAAAVGDMAVALAWISKRLPELAEIDPGPLFTARVLAATSRRPARTRLADRWGRTWAALIARPRFAIEAAYVLTLVLILVTGNPIAAFDRTTARIEPARAHLAVGLDVADRTIAAGLGAIGGRAGSDRVAPAIGGVIARGRDRCVRIVDAVAGALSNLIQTLESVARSAWQWGHDLIATTTARERDATRVR
jgi:hypothetical protein